jgi:hypothetical protein
MSKKPSENPADYRDEGYDRLTAVEQARLAWALNGSPHPPPGVIACTVGDAVPHLWTCPGCKRTWCHHHTKGPNARCGMCSMGVGF